MEEIAMLILFPFVIACLLLIIKSEKLRRPVVIASAIIIAVLSIYTAIKYLSDGTTMFVADFELVGKIMMAIEIVFGLVIFYLGIRDKKWIVSILALIQTPLMVWFGLTQEEDIVVQNNLYIDELSIIMILIIGIVGCLITVYSLGYMQDFQKHDTGKDRRPWFFFLMFVFLSAMFGIVTSNNLTWMFFFWEVTTLCSFFLIGYTKTEEATKNSYLQLTLNMIGGLAFAIAIVYLGIDQGILEFNKLISTGLSGIDLSIPVALLALAGIVKAAQMPFHSWLLGAMVAPTPTSALLHSSTMVKAGVFMILKLSPLLGTNVPGEMVMIIGAVTFLLASMAAISQSNAKRVLAYSTIANLGLIVCCGGIGTYEAMWAGIMLLIFHAVTKSLLFLCVGTAEHHIGSRNIEDMDGLFEKMPKLATCMIVGISAMFLAPFGMLISKWAALTSFVDTQNIILVICICFGSAVTAFYWTKWLGKMVAIVNGPENIEKTVHKSEWAVLISLAVLTVAVCFCFPLISEFVISPYLSTQFGLPVDSIIATFAEGNVYILLAMLALLLVVVVAFFNRNKDDSSDLYMCGVNKGDNISFNGSMGATVNVSLRNWYMEGWFGENRINKIGLVLTIATLAVCFVLVLMGVSI